MAGDGKEEEKKPAGGWDGTKIEHRSAGYTVKFTFHRAMHLPLADLGTLSSDPYVTAELKTSLPTRHKEDPPTLFRSRTVWKNTAPVWDQEWIVANVPNDGFKLKLRLYDEDSTDTDDRLGNVHITIDKVNEKTPDINEKEYKVEKRAGSWRAYLLRSIAVCMGKRHEMRGSMFVSMKVLGRTEGDEGGRVYTIGPNHWCKHSSPLLGRIAGKREPDASQYNEKQEADGPPAQASNVGGPGSPKSPKKSSERYNFQANQFQLMGPVPPELYHRYVEFRPFVKSMFTGKGVRGFILNHALHHQHTNVYNFNSDTKYGSFAEPSNEMTLKFLDLCHFDQGGRIHTYVITLDGLMRFTETGKEFGIDMLSKHTMHADRNIYITYSGEFLIRRLKHKDRPSPEALEASTMPKDKKDTEKQNQSHPVDEFEGGPPKAEPPLDPAFYELIIDNDSGTYRPNAKMLPKLREFLEMNFPGLKVVTLDCQEDEKLMSKLKDQQREHKKQEGDATVYMQKSRSSSVSSGDEERLNGTQQKHKLGEAMGPIIGDHEHARKLFGETSGNA